MEIYIVNLKYIYIVNLKYNVDITIDYMLTCRKFKYMEQKNDNQLVSDLKVGKNVNESLFHLVEKHSGIFINMVNQYMNKESRSELINDKEYYIYQAALKYDSNRNTKFSTYLGSETKWMCLNTHNRSKKKHEVDIDYIENLGDNSQHFHQIIKKDTQNKILELAHSNPDKRVYKIFELRYSGGNKNKVMPWSKVCSQIGLSVQGCINVHDQALTRIKQELKGEL